MRIGVDLDNTIISYDALFHSAAVARGLIAPGVPAEKNAVKAQVQAAHGDRAWTLLQGEVYGPQLPDAPAFPGAIEFFRRCRAEGLEVCIISHKSRFPALGARHDLQSAARQWLQRQGLLGETATALPPGDVEFHDTRAAKIQAIRRRLCDVFIDDLPEVFDENAFPATTAPILFDPAGVHGHRHDLRPVRSWSEIQEAIFAAKSA